MLADRTTLNQFLIEERQRYPTAAADLHALVDDVAMACKLVADRVACGELGRAAATGGAANVHGETQHRLDVVANEIFVRCNESGGRLSGMVSEEMEHPLAVRAPNENGRYLLVFDPLDGSSNIDVNVSVGSIFSVLTAPQPGADAQAADFLQPGTRQVCAGYAIYGPATMLVITVGTGVHAFTLDPARGEFILTHPGLRLPPDAAEFAVNASNARFWEPAVKRYVEECLAGNTGPRQKDFNMRWVASLVAETHRILMRGGVFLYPHDVKNPAGRLRLLYEASPISFIIEQAGGAASTGRERILDIVPGGLHQRVPFVFGAREEVALIEAYYREQRAEDFDAPLFGSRGLFRATA